MRLGRGKVNSAPVPGWHPDPEIRALGCKGNGPVTSVGELMQNRINPMTSRLSFYLYHDRRPAPERLQDCAQQAGQLLNCAAELEAIPIVTNDHIQEEHRRHILQMQANIYNLYTVAQEGNQEDAQHWFSHLKQDCISCHARFRAASQGAEQAP